MSHASPHAVHRKNRFAAIPLQDRLFGGHLTADVAREEIEFDTADLASTTINPCSWKGTHCKGKCFSSLEFSFNKVGHSNYKTFLST